MGLNSILNLIESVKDKKVLFVGETVVDEYCFVSPMSRPPKENILAVRERRREIYEGGTLAAYQHSSSFCDAAKITVGNKIVKTRYVEENYQRKLFEVQLIEDGKPTELLPQAILDRFDTVAIMDFGHCMFSEEIVEQLCGSSKFLCLSTQSNAHNYGFNLVTKYRRADYIVIDEPEARLAAHERDAPIEKVMRKLAEGRCNKLIVTHGKHGAYGLENGRFVHAPTFPERAIDTMGAGDAFFAVTAPMARDGSIDELMLIGNAAGTLKTQIVGHRNAVTKEALIEFLKSH